ncbi:hypothetical protein EYF80_014687 [Liparis tanakae]|uniref:Uncharacterized protein n=1 Tax=Liparis tanakae TaxID=230148 RepID=A0A4Z2ICL9_9TELE|nr:hypothetical protein EYF80_014687 [Liparis tanakae]
MESGGPLSSVLQHEQTMSEEADHFMQLHAAVDDGRHGNLGAHVGVHLLVHQPEGQTLIPNQSLRRAMILGVKKLTHISPNQPSFLAPLTLHFINDNEQCTNLTLQACCQEPTRVPRLIRQSQK